MLMFGKLNAAMLKAMIALASAHVVGIHFLTVSKDLPICDFDKSLWTMFQQYCLGVLPKS